MPPVPHVPHLPSIYPEIVQNYEKKWYDTNKNNKISACKPNQHKRNFHGIKENKNKISSKNKCKHTEKKLRDCTLCKTCNNPHFNQACTLRKCIYKTGKENIICFKIKEDKIISLLLRGTLHTHPNGAIPQIK